MHSLYYRWSPRFAANIVIGITFYWSEVGQKLILSWIFLVQLRSNYIAHDRQHAFKNKSQRKLTSGSSNPTVHHLDPPPPPPKWESFQWSKLRLQLLDGAMHNCLWFQWRRISLIDCDWKADWHMSHVTRKPVFGVSDQVWLKPACSASVVS